MTLRLAILGLSRLLLFVVLFGFLVSTLAQDSDPVLQNYSLAFENLNESVEVFSNDSQQSIEALGDASQMLRPLSTNSNVDVIAALERTVERAKTAVQNQSATDLQVQVAVLKGGFWRLVYESAVEASNESNLDLAKLRIAQVAQDMGLSEEGVSAIRDSATPLAMLTQLETGIATLVQAKVNQTAELVTDKDASYKELAEAYSLYLPIQDSPRADPAIAGLFTDTFTALIGNQTDNLSALLSQLSEQMGQFTTSASTQLSAEPTTPVTTAANPETAAPEVPSAETQATTDPVAQPVSPEIVTPEVAVAAELPNTTTATNVEASPVTQVAEPIINQELQSELARLGLAARQQEGLGERYQAQGFTSLEAVSDKFYASSAKINAALSQADQARAKRLLTDFQSSYQSLAAPILEQINPSFNTQSQTLVTRLLAAPSLRLQDGAVLTQQVDSLASILNTGSAAGLSNLETLSTGIWAGWLRAALIMLLGLLAFVPLYLLYLAFGGGNRNWQLVGWALFLLLLPLIYEGLSYLTGVISFFAGGISFLDALSQFSIFQSSLAQIIWVIITAAAIALAALGLYGICVQFGLLGQKNQAPQAATLLETQAEDPANASTFDWDEEF